jgi:hypothetical protein
MERSRTRVDIYWLLLGRWRNQEGGGLMGEAFIVRKGGVVSDTTATPTITEVSKTDTTITFTVTNNDAQTATVYYDFDDEVTSLSEDNVTLATTAESDEIEVTGLTAETEYTIYSVASAFNKMFSPQASLAITTEATPIFDFELLYDSDVSATLPLTQIDITGLSIGKNDELRMVYTFVGDTTTAGAIYEIRTNDITSNYHYQFLGGDGTSISAERFSNSRFATARSDLKTAGLADIKVSENSRFVFQSQTINRGIGAGSTSISNQNYNIVNTGTVTSITKLTIFCDRTNGIAAGSRIRLYKANTGDA